MSYYDKQYRQILDHVEENNKRFENLAQKSAQSAKEISIMISDSVQKVEAVSAGQIAKPSDDILQKLQTLKELLDSGIITLQEYETKKAELLSRM